MTAERYGETHRHWQRRCTSCAHFRQGHSPLDRAIQCANAEAPLFRASEDMDMATACRLYIGREIR